MPAEMPVAPEIAAVSRPEMPASFSKAAAGSAPSGATAMTPASRRPSASASSSASAGTSPGARRRGGPGVVVEADLDEAVQAAPARCVAVRRPSLWPARTPAGAGPRSARQGVLHHGLGLLALELADEMPASAQVSAAGPPCPRPPGPGSPRRRVTPRAARRRITSAGWNLVTTIRRGCSRPARRTQRRVNPSRTATRRSRSSASRGSGWAAPGSLSGRSAVAPLVVGPHESGEAAGVAVAAVGEQGVGFPGCSCRRIRCLRRLLRAGCGLPAGRSRPGVPREVVHRWRGPRRRRRRACRRAPRSSSRRRTGRSRPEPGGAEARMLFHCRGNDSGRHGRGAPHGRRGRRAAAGPVPHQDQRNTVGHHHGERAPE